MGRISEARPSFAALGVIWLKRATRSDLTKRHVPCRGCGVRSLVNLGHGHEVRFFQPTKKSNQLKITGKKLPTNQKITGKKLQEVQP
jgi:hypothetical protein